MRAVILRAEALVVAVVALVDSESMRSLGVLIQQLGIGPSVGRCVELLRDAIQGLQQRVAELAAALADKDAAAGLLGLLRPLVRGMARLIHASSSELAGLGLEADAARRTCPRARAGRRVLVRTRRGGPPAPAPAAGDRRPPRRHR